MTEFTIATTALDTGKLQDHARDITERHKADGLFSVHIVGWLELTRRLNKHPKLVEVHFGFASIGTLIKEAPEATAALVLQGIQRLNLSSAPARSYAASFDAASAFRTGIGESIERDLSIRYNVAVREVSKQDEFQALAQEVVDRQYDEASPELRRRVLLRAARSRAVKNDISLATSFFGSALLLPRPDSDLPARARIFDAQGDTDGAIRLLRDESDPDARSTLLHILFRRKGADEALAWFADAKLSTGDLTVNGVHTLSVMHLQRNELTEAHRSLATLSEAQIVEGPYLLFLRAALRLASVLPKPDQPIARLSADIISQCDINGVSAGFRRGFRVKM